MSTEIDITYNYSIAVSQADYDTGFRVYRCADCSVRLKGRFPGTLPTDLPTDMTCQQCTNEDPLEIPTYNATTEAFEWTASS